jgi:uncharacterized protein YbaP (TraB family)
MLLRAGEHPVWIAPALHRAPESFRLSSRLFSVADEVDTVYFERDLDAAKSFPPAQQADLYAVLAGDELIQAIETIWTSSLLNGDLADLRKLTVAQTEDAIDAAISEHVWLISSKFGVDRRVWQYVPSQKRRWIQDEAELAAAFLDYPVSEQIANLRYACDRATSKNDMRLLFEAYARATTTVMIEQTENMFQRAPQQVEAMLFQRNAVMTRHIARTIRSGDSALYVIGAAHVFGQRSIGALLEAENVEFTLIDAV